MPTGTTATIIRLEGLSWLMRKTGADGIYLDGVGYDRLQGARLVG